MGQFSPTALQKELGQYYQISVTEMKPYGAVWKITASRVSFVLKPMNGSASELEKLTGYIHQIFTTGFRELPLPIPTTGGSSCFEFAGRNYMLIPLIHGEHPSFSNAKHQERVGHLYARFHQLSSQVTQCEKATLQSWIDEFTARKLFLETILQKVGDTPRLNRIDRAVRHFGKYFIRQVDYSLHGLDSFRSHHAKGIPGGFCHNDPAPRNIIMKEQKWYLIDFEMAGMNLYLKELSTLILRVLAANGWQTGEAVRLIEAYHKIRPLDWSEQDIMPFFLCFPQKFWRFCSQRYQEKIGRSEHYFQDKIWSLINEEPLRRRALQAWLPDFCSANEEGYDDRIKPSCTIDGSMGNEGPELGKSSRRL